MADSLHSLTQGKLWFKSCDHQKIEGGNMKSNRSAKEVLDDHLRLAQSEEWDFEADLKRNFSENIVLLTSFGVYRGYEGARKKGRLLLDQLPGGRWIYKQILVEGELGFLEWSATSKTGARVEDGADSYLIRNGRIHAMSIHYTVLPPAEKT
jgi:hypothetical protein